MKLDIKDRLILHNQFKILSLVDPDQKASHDRAITILVQGFEREYDSLASAIDASVVTREVSEQVFQILEMYRVLRWSHEQLGVSTSVSSNDVTFPGFDGNHEGEHLAYGRFLNADGRFEESEVKNSHMHTLGTYRRMLEAFQPFKSKGVLSEEQLKLVLTARTHPSMHSQ